MPDPPRVDAPKVDPRMPGASGARRASTSVWQALRRHTIDTRPLRHPAYRRLFVGYATSQVGFQFTAVAVPVQMYAQTGSSGWVGLLGVAALVPLVIFAIWGGAVADLVDRRTLLLGSSLVMWTATLALLTQAVLHLTSPLLLLVLVAVQTAGFAVGSPTRQAIVARLVTPGEVAAANALNTTAMSAAVAVGPLLAGVLVVKADISAAYAVDATLFAVSLWATVRLPDLPPVRVPAPGIAASATATPVSRGPAIAGWSEVRAGFAYLAGAPVLVLSFAIDIVAMVLAMPRSLFPEVAAERFGSGSIGWLYASIAIGSFIAGLGSGWIGRVRRQGLALIVAVVVWGLAVALAGLAHSLALAVVLLAVGGAADLVSAVYRQTIVQTYAPDGLQGRMQGIFIAVVAGGPRLGDLRAGVSAAVAGTTVAWAGGGAAAAVVAIVLAVSFPALARYRPEYAK